MISAVQNVKDASNIFPVHQVFDQRFLPLLLKLSRSECSEGLETCRVTYTYSVLINNVQ